MSTSSTISRGIQYRPVTKDLLPDLARFSEGHGKFRYCSCMRWRMRSTMFQASTKEERVARLESLVCQEVPVGVLAYVNDAPVGWCSIAPRETFDALERYKGLPRIDETAVWSVVCFFVDSHFRKQGVTLGLLKAAVAYAKTRGAKIIEGYPVEPYSRLYTYMGSPVTFRKAGFRDVTPQGQARQVMRFFVE